MTAKEAIRDLLGKMNNNSGANTDKIDDILGGLLGYDKKQYLNVLTDELFDEKKCFLAINSLLATDGYFPCEKGDFGYNFIQNAIYTGYSEQFVISVVKSIIKNNNENNNFNQVDEDGDTIMHSAIYCDDYPGDYLPTLYLLLCENGFDSKITDNDGRNIIEAMKFEHDRIGKFSDSQIEKMETLYSLEKRKTSYSKPKNEEEIIETALSMIGENITENITILNHHLGDQLSYRYEDFLIVLTSNVYNEEKCYKAIYSLLKDGADPNMGNATNDNFVQRALLSGYSKSFILKILGTALDQNLEKPLQVNHTNEFGFTMLHSAIDSLKYTDNVKEIYALLCKYGFDSNIVDEDGRSVLDIMDYMRRERNKYSEEEVTEFAKIYVKHVGSYKATEDSYAPITKKKEAKSKPLLEAPKYNLTETKKRQLEEFGRILNFKKFISSPTIGRDDEVKNLMVTLAQDKKNPIIVGESGVGKTAIAEELAYRIAVGNVPNFLKNKIILEVSPNELVAGCQYVGNFEEKIGSLMKLCEELDIILFIDEIHTMYGVGSTKDKATDMSAMIKHYIDRSDLKIIGTTTEAEYQEFFAQDALKRRFEKIIVKEPEDDVLRLIIGKVMDDYCKKSGLSFENESDKEDIINVILVATENSHRVYNDKVNNPDLSISIIDKAFAFAKFYDSKHITKEHFMDSFSYCDRIYESSQERAISMLKSKKKKEDGTPKTAKIIEVDFIKSFRK